MICYASRTGTKRNLKALRDAGWRLLVSRAGEWRTEGFQYALDNGAWSDFQAQREFDEDAFERLIEKLGLVRIGLCCRILSVRDSVLLNCPCGTQTAVAPSVISF
jgi:hypothetical protein